MFWLLYKQLAQTVQLCNCIVLSQYWIPFLFWGPLLSWSQCSSCPSLTLWLERGKWSHHAPIWPEGLLQLQSFHQFHRLTAPKTTLIWRNQNILYLRLTTEICTFLDYLHLNLCAWVLVSMRLSDRRNTEAAQCTSRSTDKPPLPFRSHTSPQDVCRCCWSPGQA